MPKNDLPLELRSLVRQSVSVLGEVIREELGVAGFRRVEKLRRKMVALRGVSDAAKYDSLASSLKDLGKLRSREQLRIAHSFTLMLELMNSCENSYRSYRLRQGSKTDRAKSAVSVIYVLTSHPTEARSPENIAVFEAISKVLVDALVKGFDGQKEKLRGLLKVAWQFPSFRGRKPSVEDEASHIYSVLLRPEILDALLEANQKQVILEIRTWAGGDKDGHPYVDEGSFLRSLQLSRIHLWNWVWRRLVQTRKAIRNLGTDTPDRKMSRNLRKLEQAMKNLRVIRSHDGARLAKFHALFSDFLHQHSAVLSSAHYSLSQIDRALKIFPGMVVPLELREASDQIALAVSSPIFPIRRMLRALSLVSEGGDAEWYARALVISMARTEADFQAGLKIVKRSLGGPVLPVVPLFEQEQSLGEGPEVVARILSDPKTLKVVRKNWDGEFEVMVGYSDSAKEMGVLPSRLKIAEAIHRINQVIVDKKVQPVFFHGAGGSVDRGGGSVEEQTEWWPQGALARFKATIQGEMVERSFASAEITRRQLEQITRNAEDLLKSAKAREFEIPDEVKQFADRVKAVYQRKIAKQKFLDIVHRATPYRFLNDLKLGSRPAKRGKGGAVSSLRAIPWVLCWTQTRVLFPTWWGVGTAWKSATVSEKKLLKQAFRKHPLFRSYVKVLGYTLMKVELPIWKLYLENSDFSHEQAGKIFVKFEKEYSGAVDFVRAMSGTRSLVWFRPWLGTSIRLRSPMIHPLNLLQILTLRKPNPGLARETVTGIASGMLTTG